MRAIHVDRDRSVPAPRVRRAVRPAQMAVVLAMVMAPAGCAGSEPDSAWPTTARTGRPVAGAPATTEPVATTTTTAPSTEADQAIAAVRAYYAAWNRALISLDTSELKSLSDSHCEPCLSDIGDIEYARSQGLHVEGATATFSITRSFPPISTSLISVMGDLHGAKATLRNEAGLAVKTYPGHDLKDVLWTVEKGANGWVLLNISD